MTRAPRSRWAAAAVGALALSLLAAAAAPAAAADPRTAVPVGAASPTGAPVDSPALTTWGHAVSEATTGDVDAGTVRRSPYYAASVGTSPDGADTHSSFVYMNVPRNGRGKEGYDEQDGAEFAADNDLSMSWTSFEYGQDVWVDVTLTSDQPITSADQVILRPSNLGFEKQLVDSSTVRVKVPYSPQGYRFSVEFAPQQMSVYSAMKDAALTTESGGGNRFVEEEPRNAMLVFANPKLTPEESARTVPTDADGTIYRPQPGLVNNLDTVDADIISFGPGTYYMGSDYRAALPNRVRWVYLAPGAYVKGAFLFPGSDAVSEYKVTGRGVLSGEQYVYEADTNQPGYTHSTGENCHGSCVKMLQLSASPTTHQTLDLEGVTVNAPPYHSFVVYSFKDGKEIEPQNFHMNVSNYKQVGSWYWQTDGIELYPHGTMRDTFFHSNDDVLKVYHSDIDIQRTVIWKNENGPVIQWGWGPRSIDGVTVSDTDIIHNRMGWNDVKFNTCVFNSSSAWQDMAATDRADPSQTVKNMTFTNTRVEGAVNCAIRLFAQSNTENIVIDGFAVDAWNGLELPAQASKLAAYTDAAGTPVRLGDEMTERNGLLFHDYTVGGVPIVKSGPNANWKLDQLGRLDFGSDVDANWNATAGEPVTPSAALSASEVVAGHDVTVTGTEYPPVDAVTLWLHAGSEGTSAQSVPLGGTTADGSGAFALPTTIPTGTAAGIYRVEVRSSTGSVWLTLTVTADNNNNNGGGGNDDNGGGNGGHNGTGDQNGGTASDGGSAPAAQTLEATGGTFAAGPLWAAGGLVLAGMIVVLIARIRRGRMSD